MEPSVASSGAGDNQQLSGLSGSASFAQVAPLVSTASSGGLREKPVQMTPPHSPPPSIPTPGAVSSGSSTSSPRSATGRVMGVLGITKTSRSDMDASGSSTSGSPYKSPPPSEDMVMSAVPRADITRTVVTTETSYSGSSKDTTHPVPCPGSRKSFSDEVRKVVNQRPPVPPKHSEQVHAAKPSIVPAKSIYPYPKPTKTLPKSSTSYESDC